MKLISRWTFGNNNKNITKMNNDRAIQPLLLIVVEEYRRYCHILNHVKREETCVSYHKGQAVSLLVAMIQYREGMCVSHHKG